MKKLAVILLIFFVIGGMPVAAEDVPENEEELEVEEVREVEEVETEADMVRRQAMGANIRVGGGFSLGWLRMDMSGLNDILKAEGFADLSNNIILTGWGGTVGNKVSHRLGGFGTGGSLSASSGDKETEFEVGYGGFLYERGVYDEEEIDVAVGGMLGAGGMELTLTSSQPENFSGIVEDVADEGHNSVTMNKSFIALQPQVNMHYQFSNFGGLDLTAGYLLTHDFGSSWEIADRSVAEGPLSNFTAFNLRAQISLGF